MNSSAAPDPAMPHGRRWFAWASLSIVSLLAVVAVASSILLRDHADSRRRMVEELAQIETQATAQSGIAWQALTMLLAEDKMAFVRIRGVEQRGRAAIFEKLWALRELDEEGADCNAILGFDAKVELLDNLDAAGSSFLGGVQGILGQMSLSTDRIRQRLRYWDMNYGAFHEALTAVRQRDTEIAKASSRIANIAAGIAALITLMACALFVLRLSQLADRRERELTMERMRTTAASEARFRELVQHSNDLILVLENSGAIRYATPSAQDFANKVLDPSSLQSPNDWQSTGEFEPESDLRPIESLMGVSTGELVGNVNTEITIEDSLGEAHIFDVHATDLSDSPDIGGIVLNAHNITKRKGLEKRLRYQALHDPLTGLPNRRNFKARFEQQSEQELSEGSVLFVDLDGFKLINDSYGHNTGDRLLVETASRIKGCLQEQDLLARQGGDEFLLLINGDANQISDTIQSVMGPSFMLDDKEVFVSASIGIVSDLTGLNSDQAAQRADIAMYKAKDAGKAQAVHFAESMLAGAPERLQLEADFRKALERDEFKVYYQPKVSLETGLIKSLEALVRWEHPTRGLVGPDLFIPFAEESGLVSELGRLVLEKACMDAVRWQDRGLVVAVNLSPVQFRNPHLLREIKGALSDSGLDPRLLELEITESAVLGDVEKTIEMLAELKSLGIRLAIDDFGTGYSNLSHLKHFNVDVLKIDQAFVRGGNSDNPDNLSDAAIVEAVIGMAKAFDLHVVAEGVESAAHADQLLALGADLGQGYFFSKPVPCGAIDDLLDQEGRATSLRRVA